MKVIDLQPYIKKRELKKLEEQVAILALDHEHKECNTAGNIKIKFKEWLLLSA
jgi:hypothetical protein